MYLIAIQVVWGVMSPPATIKIQTKLQGPLGALRIRYLMEALKITRKARVAKHLSSKTGDKN
jgi:hypothetical protein